MRHIILGLLLLLTLPQPLQADDSNNFLYCLVIFGVVGLVDGIHRLAQEQQRKNDLQQEAIREKTSTEPTVDPITYFKTLEQTTQAHTAALEKLIDLHKDNPSLQEKYRAMLEKGVQVHQEVSDSLGRAQHLSSEKQKEFGLVLEQDLTRKDLQLLIALKKREYRDIPYGIIDETENDEYISLPGEPHIRISKKLLEELERRSERTA